jgi:site-specific recombinase XerD
MKHQANIYLEQFKEWLLIKGNTSATATSFIRSTKHFTIWLTNQEIEAENASHNDILAYVSHQKQKGNKQRTLQSIVNALRHFYNFMQATDIVSENPASNVIIKGVKRKELVEILSPEELTAIYQSYDTAVRTYETGKQMPPQYNNELTRKRNKVILGLFIYQGIRTPELTGMQLSDLQLREGTVTIQGSRRSEGRTLTLEAHQIYDFSDYVHTVRKELLAATNKTTNTVFISLGAALHVRSIAKYLLERLQAQHPKVKNLKHLRTSVISNWLKVHNLRQVQYMAGHRFVSSTEAYQLNNIEELQDDIKKYHPMG